MALEVEGIVDASMNAQKALRRLQHSRRVRAVNDLTSEVANNARGQRPCRTLRRFSSRVALRHSAAYRLTSGLCAGSRVRAGWEVVPPASEGPLVFG